ncbi:MAG TPA: hypothetical protein VEK07_06035 [Polyangiaceae bacterium]|nr:hypothetical protein [Polyangiaceae bacterium]
MTAPSFDSAGAIRFDLPRGAVRLAAEDERLLLVPSQVLGGLAKWVHGDALEAFGRALGAAVGRRAAARIGDVASASIEEFVTQLAGEAALAGTGLVEIERWGRALVVILGEPALPAAMVAPFVAGAVQAASGRAVEAVLLSGDEHAARVLVTSEQGAARVRGWVASGCSWGEALARLNGGRL